MAAKKSLNGLIKNNGGKIPAFRLIVVGTSAGGFNALTKVLPKFAADFPLPILVVQHLYPESTDFMAQNLNAASALKVKEAEEKENIDSGIVYIAPPNYHMLVEKDFTISLTVDPKVNFSRPSIDVLFESAVDVCGGQLIGVLLTGANADGAQGLRLIKEAGGKTIVQNPQTAEADAMPGAATNLFNVDYICELEGIHTTIINLLEK